MARQAKKISSTIQPLGDRVLVRPYTEDALRQTQGKGSSGIIIPESARKEKSAQGKVLEVGPGRYEDGKLQPMNVKKGDVIVFSRYGYDEVVVEGEELFLIREENVLAVIK